MLSLILQNKLSKGELIIFCVYCLICVKHLIPLFIKFYWLKWKNMVTDEFFTVVGIQQKNTTPVCSSE